MGWTLMNLGRGELNAGISAVATTMQVVFDSEADLAALDGVSSGAPLPITIDPRETFGRDPEIVYAIADRTGAGNTRTFTVTRSRENSSAPSQGWAKGTPVVAAPTAAVMDEALTVTEDDGVVDMLKFNESTRVLTATRTGKLTDLEVTIPDANDNDNNYVASMSFSGRVLKLTRAGLSALSVTIPDTTAGLITAATFTASSRKLTLTRTGTTDLEVTIPAGTTEISGMSFNTSSRVLTITRPSPLSNLTVTIPSGSAGTVDQTARDAAAAAQTAANNAKTAADAAATAASRAVSAASTANTAATNAATAASTAQSTADTAKSTADTAKRTADTAKTTADQAKAAVADVSGYTETYMGLWQRAASGDADTKIVFNSNGTQVDISDRDTLNQDESGELSKIGKGDVLYFAGTGAGAKAIGFTITQTPTVVGQYNNMFRFKGRIGSGMFSDLPNVGSNIGVSWSPWAIIIGKRIANDAVQSEQLTSAILTLYRKITSGSKKGDYQQNDSGQKLFIGDEEPNSTDNTLVVGDTWIKTG